MQRGFEYTTTTDTVSIDETHGYRLYTSTIPNGEGWVTYQHNTGHGVTSWVRIKP